MKTIASRIKGMFSAKDSSHLEKEIQSIIDAGEEDGLIDPQSGEMIQSILEFRDTIVREVMIPRTEMVAIQSDTPIEEIIGLITRYGHTRMPLYSGSVDNIAGILNAEKNVLGLMPHPENLIESAHGGFDGRALFAALLDKAA